MISPANLPAFSKDEFLSWVGQQTGPYEGHACAQCAMTQFGKAVLGEECDYSMFSLYEPLLPVKLQNAAGKTIGLIAPFSAVEMKVIITSKTFEELRENFNVNS